MVSKIATCGGRATLCIAARMPLSVCGLCSGASGGEVVDLLDNFLGEQGGG